MKIGIWLSAAMALRRREITIQEIWFIIPGDLLYVMERLDQLVEWLFFPDESTGRQALIALLKTADYQKLSVSDPGIFN